MPEQTTGRCEDHVETVFWKYREWAREVTMEEALVIDVMET